jgi:hypothetical protein
MQPLPLKAYRRGNRLVQVMVRLPPEIREVAKKLATENSSVNERLTETDVYRSAILFFLSTNSTDSRDEKEETKAS